MKKTEEKITQSKEKQQLHEDKCKEKEKEKEMAESKYRDLKKLVRARSVKPLPSLSQISPKLK